MIVLQNKRTGKLVGATFDASKRILQLDSAPLEIGIRQAKKDYYLLDACGWEKIELRERGVILQKVR